MGKFSRTAMLTPLDSEITEALAGRQLPDGSFAAQAGGAYRPDATAWGILAVRALAGEQPELHAARTRLAADQQADGRVPLTPEHPEALWPTPLAILAWQGAAQFREVQAKAVHFLLKSSGQHFPKKSDSPFGHDSTIRGWSWIEGTHSWVMPSALAVQALSVAGYSGEERVQEARQMLLNRQLPSGGWNYGNTTVYGQTLHPMPETTGAALLALADSVEQQAVAASLAYLAARVAQVRTPLSLAWGLLGLTAWGARPAAADQWLLACWQRQARYGTYDTVALALLILAWTSQDGLGPLFSKRGNNSANTMVTNG